MIIVPALTKGHQRHPPVVRRIILCGEPASTRMFVAELISHVACKLTITRTTDEEVVPIDPISRIIKETNSDGNYSDGNASRPCDNAHIGAKLTVGRGLKPETVSQTGKSRLYAAQRTDDYTLLG